MADLWLMRLLGKFAFPRPPLEKTPWGESLVVDDVVVAILGTRDLNFDFYLATSVYFQGINRTTPAFTIPATASHTVMSHVFLLINQDKTLGC